MPLPATTQWEIVEEAAELLKPAHEELIRQGAQGEIFHNDDTSMKILKLDARTETRARGCSPVGSSRSGEAIRLPCTSPGGSMRARIWRMC